MSCLFGDCLLEDRSRRHRGEEMSRTGDAVIGAREAYNSRQNGQQVAKMPGSRRKKLTNSASSPQPNHNEWGLSLVQPSNNYYGFGNVNLERSIPPPVKKGSYSRHSVTIDPSSFSKGNAAFLPMQGTEPKVTENITPSSEPDAVMGDIYSVLRNLEIEHPSIRFEKEITRDLSIFDVRSAICTVIAAYQTVNQCTKDAEDELDKLEAHTKLKDNALKEASSRELAQNEMIAELRRTNDHDRGRCEGIIATLKDSIATREHKVETKVQQLQRQHQLDQKALLDSHERKLQQLNQDNSLTLQNKVAELRSATDEIARLKANREDDRTKLRAEHQRRLATVESAAAQSLDNLRRELEAAKIEKSNMEGEHEREKQFLKDEYEATKLSIKDSHHQDKMAYTKSLQETVEVLKAALVKRDHFKAMSDHELAYRFQDISSEVDEFARATWEKKFDSTWPLPGRLLRNLENERRTKQYLIQNTLWFILWDAIFCTPFRIFGKEGKDREAEWIKTFGKGTLDYYPPASKESEIWRYEAMKKCVEAVSQSSNTQSLNNSIKLEYEASLNIAVDDMSKGLERVTSFSPSERQRMYDLVKKAAKLWLEVGQQRYRTSLVMAASGEKPMLSTEKELSRNGSLSLVVTPGLLRNGNAQGERLDKADLVAGCGGIFTVFSVR